MVGRGGALPRCCAPPHEQIFDIPALSRGGGARSVKFPPPSGLIGLCFRGWGRASKTVQFRDPQLSPNTRSKGEPWSPEDAGRIVYFQFSPRRGAWRESLPIRAPQSLYPSSGDAVRDQWARSRRLPPPPALSLSPLSEVSDAALCFSESARCCFHFSFGSGLATPSPATFAGLEFFLPAGFLFSFSVI